MRTRATGVVIKDNKVLLIKRFNNGKQYYVFPGGGVEEGETVEEALIRELKEETSLNIKVSRKLWTFDTEWLGQTIKHVNFLVNNFSGSLGLGGPEKEKNSEINSFELVWVPFTDVGGLALYPEEAKSGFIKEFC